MPGSAWPYGLFSLSTGHMFPCPNPVSEGAEVVGVMRTQYRRADAGAILGTAPLPPFFVPLEAINVPDGG